MGACNDRTQDSSGAEPRTMRHDSAMRADPARTFARERAALDTFLMRSLEPGSHDLHRFDSLRVSWPDGESGPSRWLADYRVLGGERIDDTVIVAAEIVRVAERRESLEAVSQFDVEPRIVADTLHGAVVETGQHAFPEARDAGVVTSDCRLDPGGARPLNPCP